VFNPLTAPNPLDDLRNFISTSRYSQRSHRLAYNLFGGVAENSFSSAVPGENDAVQVLADDGVVGGLHNSGKPLLKLRRVPLLCDVAGKAPGVNEPVVLPVHVRSNRDIPD
jgi:hypothetical protein